tara:strand:- start:225 stop:710 length:486 start_codon:yes stop_codon:yes gene_type:complete
MSKFYQVIFVVILLSLSSFNYAALVSLEENVDDFTDEVSYTLSFVDDSENGIFGINCSNSQQILIIMPQAMWETDNTKDVQFRFDKNEPFTERLGVTQYKGVFSRNKSFINKILRNIKQSEDFLIKVGTEDTQRHTGITSMDKKKVDRFIELSSAVPTCSG